MKIRHALCLFITAAAATVAFAADPSGTWKWVTHSPNGDIATTLTLEAKDGKLTGAYSNEFGDTAISGGAIDGDGLAFEVVRRIGGSPYVVKYRGRLEGDVINGTIEAPGHEGGQAVTLDWKATRAPVGSSGGPKAAP